MMLIGSQKPRRIYPVRFREVSISYPVPRSPLFTFCREARCPFYRGRWRFTVLFTIRYYKLRGVIFNRHLYRSAGTAAAEAVRSSALDARRGNDS